MVKFLKFVLFIVIIAFAFALGVKFSDSFKNNLGNLKEDEIKIETEMNKAFDNMDSEIHKITNGEEKEAEITPLTEEEKNEVINQEGTMPEYVDIEIVEPMDGVAPMPADPTNNPEAVQQPAPANTNAPVAPATGTPAPTQAPVAEQAPGVEPVPAQVPVSNTNPAQPAAPTANPTPADAQPSNAVQPATAPTAQPVQQAPVTAPARAGQATRK